MCYFVDAVDAYISDMWHTIMDLDGGCKLPSVVVADWPKDNPLEKCHEMITTS